MTSLKTEESNEVTRLVFCPPEGKPVTLEEQLLGQIMRVLKELERRPPRLLVLASAAPKYFCVGADVEALRQVGPETIGTWVRLGHRVFNRLEDLACPVVAEVHGYALGGGLELALACDLIFAADGAVFGQTEAKLGFIPGWGGTLRLAERVGLPRAKRMFYTGELMDTEAAVACGLADITGTGAEIEEQIRELARTVAGNSAYAIGAYKRVTHLERLASRRRCEEAEAEFSLGCLEESDAPQRLEAFLNRKRKD